MKARALLLCAAVAGSAHAGAPKPTPAALERAFEANRATLVEVVGPKDRGAGVVVGADGQVLTSTLFVSLETAEVRVGQDALPARVVMANAALKVAVLSVQGKGPWPSAAVALDAPLEKGTWLIGLSRSSRGEVKPSLGRVSRAAAEGSSFLSADLPLPPGSPLFDAKGRLVAVAVQARAGGCRALPLSAVKLQLVSEAPAP